MPIFYRTYTYRIYPNEEQKTLINMTFMMCRYTYNTLLKIKMEIHKRFVSYIENCLKNEINPDEADYFKKDSIPSLKKIKLLDARFQKIDSLSLYAEKDNVVRAFQNYYDGRAKIPHYKKRRDQNIYTTSNVNQNIRREGALLRIPKIGFIKTIFHRPMPNNSNIKKVIIKEDKCGKYFAAIILEIDGELEKNSNVKENGIGLDFKVGDIYVDSKGNKPIYMRPYRNALNRLRQYEKELGRKIKFSKGYWKCIQKIRKLHHTVAFKRKDFLHKLSTNLTKNYSLIVVENLSLQEIASKLKNGINTYDTSYDTFVQMLTYKVSGIVFKINKWFPSSKTCSGCGHLKRKLKLGQKIYQCHYCGIRIDRDLNAAINIYREGIRTLKNGVLNYLE